MDTDDVGVPQLSSRSGLTKELLRLGGAQFAFARNLDRNGSVKLPVAGLENNGKRPSTDLLREIEVPKGARSRRFVGNCLLTTQETETAAAGWACDIR